MNLMRQHACHRKLLNLGAQDYVARSRGKCAVEILSPDHLPGKAGGDKGGGHPEQSEEDRQRRHSALRLQAHSSF